MKDVIIVTDGACIPNPGAGGWAAILKYGGARKIIQGGEKDTTNNRMELTAVIKGLASLKEPCNVTVISDSRYVTDAYNQDWISRWRSNILQRVNADLWIELDSLVTSKGHNVTFKWVRGHSGHPDNELVDKVANAEIKNWR